MDTEIVLVSQQSAAKPTFTKGELKTYSAAARDAGIGEWAIERTDANGVTTKFICGDVTLGGDGQTEWDKHEP